MTVFMLNRYGDDYHGEFTVMGIYATEEAALEEKKRLEGEQERENPCHPEHPECNFKYDYTISQEEVRND